MNLTRIAATAGIAGALGFAAWGLGTGLAQADNDDQPSPPAPAPNIPPWPVPPQTPPPPTPWWANGAPMVWDWGGHQWGVLWNNVFLPIRP